MMQCMLVPHHIYHQHASYRSEDSSWFPLTWARNFAVPMNLGMVLYLPSSTQNILRWVC